MATNAPITGAPTRAPFNPAPPAAVTRVLTRFDRADLASFIAVAIDLLDVADDDADVEPNGDELDGTRAEDEAGHCFRDIMPGCILADGLEHDESQTDAAWRETINQAAPQFRHKDGESYAYAATGTPEDAEDADPAEDSDSDYCLAGDDRVASGPVMGGGGYLAEEGPGDADDAEREQMIDDVPMLPVVAIEPNLFDGKRPYLGRGNLMTSFHSNGGAELSADTGRKMKRLGNLNRPRVGTPV